MAIELDPRERKDLLVKSWMTHDAMWFAHSVEIVGIETANRLNRAAVRSMAAVEAKRILRATGVDEVRDFDALRRYFDAARELLMGSFMEFEWTWLPEESSVRFQWHRCFAYEGVLALGVVDDYECGIYDRVYGWLDALGVAYDVTPDVAHCTMHTDGTCVRTVRLHFPA